MNEEKVSVSSIVDPMLLAGKHTRAEIMAEVNRLRPDFKDPSAAVSNGFRRLVAAGKYPALMGTELRKRASPIHRAFPQHVVQRRAAMLDEWAARLDTEICAGFKRRDAYMAAQAAMPRMRRIWP